MHTYVDDIQRLRSLTANQIQEVIEDLQLQRAGTKIYFCVDPHELYDFCFPVDPLSRRDVDIDTVSDDQIALYETFYRLEHPPLLLPEYLAELESLTQYLEHYIRQAYRTPELLERFVQDAQLGSIPAADADPRSPAVDENVNVYLALAMAVNRLGIDRFVDVVNRHLRFDPEDDDVAAIWNRYKKSDRAETVREALSKNIEASAGSSRKLEVERQLRSALYDSAAADRVVYLNGASNGKDAPEQIFLYLSSARRTESIFHHPAIRKALPVIKGQPYRLWRTRSQMFAYVVSKGAAAGEEGVETAIQNLKQAHKALTEFGSIAPHHFCETCVLRDGSGDECDRGASCRSLATLAKEIRRRREEIFNLGLIAALKNYKDILSSRVPANEVLRSIMDLLNRLAAQSTPERVNVDLKRVRVTLRIQSEFATVLTNGLAEWEGYADPDFLRGRDAIVSASQYMPNRPRLKDPRYTMIVSRIIDFYETPATGAHGKSKTLEAAYRDFVQLDAQTTELKADHELVRCLLYMSLPNKIGDRLALKQARTMMRSFANDPDAAREFRYVAGWAARRSRKYPLAHQILRSSEQMYPDDPRFLHGRALNVFAWRVDLSAKRTCPHTLQSAISAIERAITLYQNLGDDAYTILLGACWNDLAYFHAQPQEQNTYDVVRARAALVNLKTLVPPAQWDNYPEYFHTEAFVEFEEATAAKAKGDEWLYTKKLGWAYQASQRALSLNPSDPDFITLDKAIRVALDELSPNAEPVLLRSLSTEPLQP